MTEWFYKATRTKVSFDDTRDLAIDEGFICRSAFKTNKTRVNNTRNVDVGDLLHVYFTGDREPKVIGTFEIIEPSEHATPSLFGEEVAGTKLFIVADAAFEKRLRAMKGNEGYEPDPVLKKVTGWVLKVRPDVSTPSLARAPFNNQATLVRGR